MVQIVHISDKAVVRQKKSHPGQQHGKVNPVISILGLGILRNCPKRGKKEKKRHDSGTAAPLGPAADTSHGATNGASTSFMANEEGTYSEQPGAPQLSGIKGPSPKKPLP